MKKKFLTIVLSTLIVLSAIGCTDNSASNENPNATPSDATIKEKLRKEKDDFDSATNVTLTFWGYDLSLPSSWTEGDNSSLDLKTYYAETREAVAMFQLQCIDSPFTDVEDLNTQKDTFIEAYGNSFDTFEVSKSSKRNIADIEGIFVVFSGSTSGLDVQGKMFSFVSETGNNLISIVLIQSTNTEYSYFDTYEKVLKTITTTADPFATYPTVTYDDISTGSYNGKTVCIEAIVDNLDGNNYSCSFDLWYPSNSSYIYDSMNNLDDNDENIPKDFFGSLKNGDIIKYVTTVYDDGSFGTTQVNAIQIAGCKNLDEVYSVFKNSCQSMNYTEVQRNPDNFEDQYFKITGSIQQIVEESSSRAEYLISTDAGLVYVNWFLDEDFRGSRFLKGDEVMVCGEFSMLKTYDTLISQNTVPEIIAITMDLIQ